MKVLNENVSKNIMNKLNEGYVEEIGGEPEDFIHDMEELKKYLNLFNVSKFGTHLASQILIDFVETLYDKIETTKEKYNL